MKILLIEDDATIGDAIKSSLEKADYLVEWAKNGLEGEIALTDSQFEAVILDLGLPKKHGLDILKNLRSKKNQFPVLIISANENIDNTKASIKALSDYVKPEDPNAGTGLYDRLEGFKRDVKDIFANIKNYVNRN